MGKMPTAFIASKFPTPLQDAGLEGNSWRHLGIRASVPIVGQECDSGNLRT